MERKREGSEMRERAALVKYLKFDSYVKVYRGSKWYK
jgi:hypothetical protein